MCKHHRSLGNSYFLCHVSETLPAALVGRRPFGLVASGGGRHGAELAGQGPRPRGQPRRSRGRARPTGGFPVPSGGGASRPTQPALRWGKSSTKRAVSRAGFTKSGRFLFTAGLPSTSCRGPLEPRGLRCRPTRPALALEAREGRRDRAARFSTGAALPSTRPAEPEPAGILEQAPGFPVPPGGGGTGPTQLVRAHAAGHFFERDFMPCSRPCG
jgi:hypothetical protein